MLNFEQAQHQFLGLLLVAETHGCVHIRITSSSSSSSSRSVLMEPAPVNQSAVGCIRRTQPTSQLILSFVSRHRHHHHHQQQQQQQPHHYYATAMWTRRR